MIQNVKIKPCSVRGVLHYELRHVVDRARGNLTVGEIAQDLPFQPRRWFMTYAVPDSRTRGEHAHRQCSQFLVCAHGRCVLRVDDGSRREEFHLDRPTLGVLVPPMVWAVEHRHTVDSVLLVLASHPYDPDDYIRDYSEFLDMVSRSSSPS